MTKHHFTFAERYAIWEVYGHVCLYCEQLVSWPELEIDHVISENLAEEPTRLQKVVQEYGLPVDFEINSFQNWVCSHSKCNRRKSNRELGKSATLHFLGIAATKADAANKKHRSLLTMTSIDKVLAPLRALLESGKITRHDVILFARNVVLILDVTPANPLVVSFSVLLDDAHEYIPGATKLETPYLYDWLEQQLLGKLGSQIPGEWIYLEDERNGESMRLRLASHCQSADELDILDIAPWEITDVTVHSEVYGSFVDDELGIAFPGHGPPANDVGRSKGRSA